MRHLKILIAVATWNRPNVTRLCLENLQEIRGPNASVMIYDDCSSAYDVSFLDPYCDGLLRFRLHGGIERSRARAFRDFVHRYSEFDILYLTDNDTIHDPRFIDVLNEFFTEQEHYPFAHPVGVFRSVFHENAIEQQFEKFFVSKTCPGVSQAYNREMAEKIVHLLDTNPMMETVYGWDYHWPAALNRPFLIPIQSYLEHFGRDKEEGGLHCPISGSSEDSIIRDLNRDQAQNPTDYLKKIRPTIIDKLLSPTSISSNQQVSLNARKDKRLLREKIARRYIAGSGIEIGALGTPLDLPPSANVKFVDRVPLAQLLQEYPEMANRKIQAPDITDNGETLNSVPNGSLDFIVANHFLEHCENFLGTLRTHAAKLRQGGVLFYAVPNRDYTFDRHRAPTEFEHLVRDDLKGPELSRSAHYLEWATLVAGKSGEEATAHARELEDARYSIHFHAWDAPAFLQTLTLATNYIKFPGYISHFELNFHEFICVLVRTR